MYHYFFSECSTTLASEVGQLASLTPDELTGLNSSLTFLHCKVLFHAAAGSRVLLTFDSMSAPCETPVMVSSFMIIIIVKRSFLYPNIIFLGGCGAPSRKANRKILRKNKGKNEEIDQITMMLCTNGSKVMSFRVGNPLTPQFFEVCTSLKLILPK